MKHIPPSDIPQLPVQDIINEECVAYGIGEPGVIIQFMDRDDCILVEWADVVLYGIELMKAEMVKNMPHEEEISKPTAVD